MPGSAKTPKLSIKEAKLIKARLEGKNMTEAGMIATGNKNPESARVVATRMLQKVTVQEAMQIAMAERNLTPDRIAKVVDEGMDASKTVILGNGEEAFADVVPDHSIRLKAAGMAASFMGLNKSAEGSSVHFHQHIEQKKEQYDF